jgi:hypothetical protein
MIIVLCFAVGSFWAKAGCCFAAGDETAKVEKPIEAKDDTKDVSPASISDDEVLVSVSGKELKKWQLDALMEQKPGVSYEAAVDNWVDIQLRADEARRRGLDKSRGAEFLMQIHKDFCLGLLLGKAVMDEVPDITEQEAQAQYDRDIKQYDRPFKVTLQHVFIKDEAQAKKAAEEARAPGAVFDDICKKYSETKHQREGRISNATHEKMLDQLGPEVTKAVESFDKKLLEGENADKAARIIGPLPNKDGFELVRVISITEAYTISFNKAKEQIMPRLKSEKQGLHKKTVMEKLQADAKVVKTEALSKLIEQDNAARANVPAQPLSAPHSPDLKPQTEKTKTE